MGFASFVANRSARFAVRGRAAWSAREVRSAACRTVEALEGRTLFATYNVLDLGVSITPDTDFLAINNSGQVALNDFGTNATAKRFSGGSLGDVGGLAGATDSIATGINASGNVVGHSNSSSSTQFRAFIWNGSTKTDLGTLGGDYSNAWAVNDNGQVVGASLTAPDGEPGTEHAFLWQNGTMTDLGTLSAVTLDVSAAYAINNNGQVAGESSVLSGERRAFRWTSGTMVDLGVLAGGDESAAYGINDAGLVVGRSTAGNAAEKPYRAFVHDGTSISGLGVLAGDNHSEARDINNLGVIVGFSADNADIENPRAFVYTGGNMVDLNSQIDAGSGWTLERAMSINDSGQIVGVGTLNGQARAFLLTPTGGTGDLTVPVAGNITVTPPTAGATTLTVSVTYTDNDAVNAGSIDVNDLSVTRNGGGSPLAVTGVSRTTDTNADLITATYTLTAPGGTWDSSDDGTYTVLVRSGQVSDASGNFAASISSSFSVNFSATSGPTATISPIATITTAGGTTGTVTVTYADPGNVAVSTIDVNDLLIVGGGQSLVITGVTTNPGSNATSIVATYTFTPPGGTWDSDDNDTYTVSVVGSQVTDTNGNPATATSANFTVNVPVVIPTLDPTFNAATPVNNGFIAESMLADLDGRIYVAGRAGSLVSGTSVGILRRYNADGSLDATFGSGGQVTTPAGQNDAYFNLAFDPTGKQVVVSGARGGDFLVARYNTRNGRLDTKYGTRGAAVFDRGGSEEAAYGLAVAADQKVYIAGSTAGALAFLRLDKRGRIDTSYGLGGTTLLNIASAGTVSELVLTPDGGLAVAGDLDGAVVVTKLANDGAIDPSFNGGVALTLNQLATRNDLGGPDRTIGLAIQTDGKLLVANRTPGGEFGVVRLTTVGTADTTFSGDGFASADLGGTDDDADAVLVQGTGQIVLVGTSNAGGSAQTAVAVFQADGTPATDFDDDGEYTVAAAVSDPATALVVSGQPVFASGVIQPNGKLLVATSSGSATSGSALRRINLPGSGQLGQFGVVNGRRTSLAFTDADGTKVTLSLKTGTATAFYNGTNLDLTVVGSTSRSSISAKTRGGDGRVRFGDIRTDGPLGGLSARTGDVFGTFAVNGALGKVDMGTLVGTLAATGSISSLSFRGDLAGAEVLAGANLGADGRLGGGDDSYAAAVISKFAVSGAVAASVVGAGFDPVDGDLFNGGTVIGGPASAIRSISVRNATDGASRFYAGAFGRIKAPERVDVATDPRFEIL
jgi:uncharacterized delta-60 repeat protein